MKLYDLQKQRRLQRRDSIIQAAAAMTGLLGAALLASKGEHAALGWWAFLASNASWILFGWLRELPWLVLQQVGFTATTVWGIWNWLGAA